LAIVSIEYFLPINLAKVYLLDIKAFNLAIISGKCFLPKEEPSILQILYSGFIKSM